MKKILIIEDDPGISRAMKVVLSEEGYKNLRVDINCIGDKESINAYARELTNYARKFDADLSNELRQSIKKDVFNDEVENFFCRTRGFPIFLPLLGLFIKFH